MTSLNDAVANWGQTFGVHTYSEAKHLLVGDLTQDQVAAYGDDGSYNDGLYNLATNSPFSPLGWKGFWSARQGTASTVPNLGSGGIGSATNNSDGLVKVTGPTAWFPGIAANYFSVPRGLDTIPPGDQFACEVIGMKTVLAGSSQQVYGLANAAGGWYIRLVTNNRLLFGVRDTVAETYVTSSSPSTIPSYDFNGIKIVRRPGFVDFFLTWDNGETWVSLGTNAYTTQATAVTTSNMTFPLSNLGELYTGEIGGVRVYDADGVKTFDLKPSDIPSDPAATSFVCSTGQTITISRGTAGPVTTIVPAGKSVFINPDHTNNNNYLSIPDHVDFNVNHSWGCFQLTNGNASNTHLSVPASASISGFSACEWVWKCDYRVLEDTGQNFWSQQTAGGELGYYISRTAGGFSVSVSFDGINWGAAQIAINHAELTVGNTYWFKITFDGSVVTGYYAASSEEEPTSWTASSAGPKPMVGTMHTCVTAPVRLGYLWNVYGVKLYRAILRSSIDGTTVLDIGRHDIPASGSSFTCKTGQTVTINGTVPITPRSGEDAILFWVGQKGNTPAESITNLFTNGNGSSQNSSGVSLRDTSAGTGLAGRLGGNAASNGYTSFATSSYSPGATNKCIHVVYVKRSTQTLVRRSYDSTGMVSEHSVSSSTAGAILPAVQRAMLNQPGTVYAWGWNKGTDIIPTNDELDKLAKLLLEEL